jgi:hypothetical protein
MGTRTPSVQYGVSIPFGTKTITAAVTGVTTFTYGAVGLTGLGGARYVGFQGILTYGSGGTTVKAWLQTSFDNGVTWVDIANMAFTTATLTKVGAVSTSIAAAAPATPTDGSLADNTINNGLIGDRLRIKYTTTGTYAGGTTLKINAWAKA